MKESHEVETDQMFTNFVNRLNMEIAGGPLTPELIHAVLDTMQFKEVAIQKDLLGDSQKNLIDTLESHFRHKGGS